MSKVFAAPTGTSALNVATLPSRIVTLGDSITDGETYALLMARALDDAGIPLPRIINAGVASDTAAMMLARIERDVLPFNPGLVTLLAGTNDAMRGVSLADYSRDVREIASRLQAHGIPMMLLTPPICGDAHANKNSVLHQYAEALREIAEEYGYLTARTQEGLARACAEIFSHDDIHLSFEGYRVVTRALLDAFGLPEVAVPEELFPPLLPGVQAEWQVRIAPDDVLCDDMAAGLTPDAGWTSLSLPQSLNPAYAGEENHWWPVHERMRGFAYLTPLLGAATVYHAHCIHLCATGRQAYLNTGAAINSVWLNGTRVHRQQEFTGWHAGKERIPVQLRAGENVILAECGETFFLSLTDGRDW